MGTPVGTPCLAPALQDPLTGLPEHRRARLEQVFAAIDKVCGYAPCMHAEGNQLSSQAPQHPAG